MSITFYAARVTEQPNGVKLHSRVDSLERFEVNVSNMNAFRLLGEMDVEDVDYCGSMAAEEFLSRSLTALLCSADDEYLVRKFDHFADLATVAKATGSVISWA